MIDIVYEKKDGVRTLHLAVSGHAGQAEHGKDLVCAAASILVYTLAQNLMRDRAGGLYAEVDVSLFYGTANISCTAATAEEYERAKGIFSVILAGMELLAENTPQYVKLTRYL